MVNYVLAAFFLTLGILTVAGNLATSELVVGLTFITLAAMIVVARWQYEKYAYDLTECMKNHPSSQSNKQSNNWPTETAVYDWSKDQEGTE